MNTKILPSKLLEESKESNLVINQKDMEEEFLFYDLNQND